MKQSDGERVLKPCPFCGGYAQVGEDMRFASKPYDFPKWYVFCRECAVQTPIASIKMVVERWNKRVNVSDKV